jgi:hypothetical protein
MVSGTDYLKSWDDVPDLFVLLQMQMFRLSDKAHTVTTAAKK